MTVRELIDKLKALEPGLPVYVQDRDERSTGPHEQITCDLHSATYKGTSDYVEIGWSV